MSRKIEIAVGFFMMLVIISCLFIALKMTNGAEFNDKSSYRIYAVFDDIGGLKPKSPIKIGGVVIGRVSKIVLDTKQYKPYVTIDIDSKYNEIPNTSSLAIKTSGILGEQYIGVNLGLNPSIGEEIDSLGADDSTIQNNNASDANNFFKQGFVVTNTMSAMVLEDLIGKFLYNTSKSDKEKEE